jgi:hypothetical protein
MYVVPPSFFIFLRYRWYCLLEEGVLLWTPTATGHLSWPPFSFVFMYVSIVLLFLFYSTREAGLPHITIQKSDGLFGYLRQIWYSLGASWAF